jgi:hypothetical protein
MLYLNTYFELMLSYIFWRRKYAESEGVNGGARNRRKGACADGDGTTTTILAPVTIENHVDVGDHVVTNVQRKLLRMRDAQK